MKQKTYNQCTLQRFSENSNSKEIRVSWIPSEYAFKNKVLSLKDNNIWSDWKIISVGPPHLSDLVEKHESIYRTYIKNTDI